MSRIKLNNQEYKLKYDFNSICELEESMNKGLSEILKEKNLGFLTIRNLLWVGLIDSVPGITAKLVGNWIQDGLKDGLSLDEITKKIMNSLSDAGILGEKTKDENKVVGENQPGQ